MHSRGGSGEGVDSTGGSPARGRFRFNRGHRKEASGASSAQTWRAAAPASSAPPSPAPAPAQPQPSMHARHAPSNRFQRDTSPKADASSDRFQRPRFALAGGSAADATKWAELQSRLRAIRDKQRQAQRMYEHQMAQQRTVDDGTSSKLPTHPRSSFSSTHSQLLTCMEELRHGFVYPLASSILPLRTFFETIDIIIDILQAEEKIQKERQEKDADEEEEEDEEDSHQPSSSTSNLASDVASFRQLLGRFFQWLSTCISRKQLQVKQWPEEQMARGLGFILGLLHPDGARASADPSSSTWLVGWLRLDALRVVAQLLANEARHEPDTHGTGTDSAPGKGPSGKSSTAPSAPSFPPSRLIPYHHAIFATLTPYIDLTQLARVTALLEVAANDSSTSGSNTSVASSDPLDVVEAQQRLYIELEYRRIAMQCLAHLAGRTSSVSSMTAASSASSSSFSPTPHPDPEYLLFFPPLVHALDVYYRESSRSNAWIALLDACIKTAAAMLEDVTTALFGGSQQQGRQSSKVAPTPTSLSASQAADLNSALVSFISSLHKCICWGTPLVIQSDHIASHANHTAASSSLSSKPKKDQLTPRAPIAPPSLSPSTSTRDLSNTGSANRYITSPGALFSPNTVSFSLLTNEHWHSLHNRYALLATVGDGGGGGSGSEQSDTGRMNGWTSANDSDGDTYQSRVRGPKPTRPSAVAAALAATAAGLPLSLSSSASSSESARRLAHATAAEKIRCHALQAFLALARLAPRFLHQHWAPYVPTDAASALSSRPFAGPSLVTLLLHDPAPRVRTLAAQCLAAGLVDSPLTRWSGAILEFTSNPATSRLRSGSGAKDKKSATFTSLSTRLGDTLRGLHRGLLEALRRESNTSVLAQLLKTLTVLVQHTPYIALAASSPAKTSAAGSTKMNEEEGVLVPIVVHLLAHMLHEPSSAPSSTASNRTSEASLARRGATLASIPSSSASSKADLRQSIFSCLAVIFDSGSVTPELRAFLTPPSSPASAPSFRVDAISLFIAHARARRVGDLTPDAWTLLAKIARNYPKALAAYWRWQNDDGRSVDGISEAAVGGGNSLSKLIRDVLRPPAVARTLHAGSTRNFSSLHQSGPPSDVQTRLLALSVLEEWNKQVPSASVSATSSQDGTSGAVEEDDEDGSGGNFEPVHQEGGFFSLEGSSHMFGTELVALYREYTGAATVTSADRLLTPAEVHAQRQQLSLAAGVRAKLLACWALMPWHAWQRFDNEQRMTLSNLALDAAIDSATAVRTAACRCLCLFSLYAARHVGAAGIDDTTSQSYPAASSLGFVRRSVRLLLGMLQPDSGSTGAVAVKIKAAWALANLADFSSQAGAPSADNGKAPVRTFEQSVPLPPTPAMHQLLPAPLYSALLDTMLQLAQGDQEKILSNAVRALGNIAKLLPLDGTASDVQPSSASGSAAPSSSSLLLPRIIHTLLAVLQSARAAKSQWNAAHALGSALRNIHLPHHMQRQADVDAAMGRATEVLLDVMQDRVNHDVKAKSSATQHAGAKSTNFKVRISATAALAAPPSRLHYGSAFLNVLRSLLLYCQAMLSSSSDGNGSTNTAGFKEFKYLSQLRSHVVATLCHVLALSDSDDGSGSGGSTQLKLTIPAKDEGDLSSLFVQHASFIARLLLSERLRLETELKQHQRLEHQARLQAEQRVGTKPSTLSSASMRRLRAQAIVTTMSKANAEQTLQVVGQAAKSVEHVLQHAETAQPSLSGLASRFAAQANGEIDQLHQEPLLPLSPFTMTMKGSMQ